MSYLELAKRIRAGIEPTMTAEPADGDIIAVLIDSTLLAAEIWLSFRDDFNPQDGKAVFYAHELPLLRNKTPEQLREIHKVKLAFGRGTRVSQ
jgi:hypothetical protein